MFCSKLDIMFVRNSTGAAPEASFEISLRGAPGITAEGAPGVALGIFIGGAPGNSSGGCSWKFVEFHQKSLLKLLLKFLQVEPLESIQEKL